jgi:D-alanyl-D-alanine carboxypeptidase/D-alanyl-D-alanine-endopeptidase (penicillin-binding protein 4)
VKNILKHITLLILFICLAASVQAQNITNSIDEAIGGLAKDSSLKNASISFVVKDLDSNVIISEYNPNISLPSASTMKVVTTAAALDILGSYLKFETKIMYDGYIDSNNVLHGNIYIKGGGDPTLGSKYFKEKYGLFMSSWVHEISKLGIDSIAGSVIGDASLFSDEYVASTWSWGDIGNYYGAGVSGLTIYDNTVKFEFSSGPLARDSTFVDCFYPYTPDLIIDNRVKASNTKKDLAYIYGGPNNPTRTIKGTIPKGQVGYVVKGSNMNLHM